jgi:beta-mannosidase
MKLPNNWYVEGINHAGVIWFEKRFYTKELPQASAHFLKFEGVDYLCDVWVNERYVGAHIGYFQPFEFDISEYLLPGSNHIKVRVNSPLENYPNYFSLHKTLLRGIFSHHDTRPGGAWSAMGQDKNSGGIWNNISIESYKHHKFSNVRVTPTLVKDGVKVDISLSIEDTTPTSHNALLFFKQTFQKKDLKVTIEPYNFKGKRFRGITKLKNKKKQSFSLHLKGAKQWFTHDRGFPHLYTITFHVGDTTHSEVVGFKTLVQNEKSQFLLNGTPLYLKGTNYISSQYLSEMTQEKFKKDLALMKEAHINTVRVHAHIEPKTFYRLCDEMGFLVWQDYNLQWGYHQSKAFKEEALKQAKEMVDLLYNHASIMLWSLHNEPPWNSEWMKWKYPDYHPEQNKHLDEMLTDALKAYDTYHPTKMLSSNLEHPWFGWYSGKYQDFVKPSKAPIVSEYGAQAIPHRSSLEKILPKEHLFPKNAKAKKMWEYHNFQFNWSKKNGIVYKGNTQQFIEASQQYQKRLIKYATEMLRLQKYQGTTAIFQFMFNEGWPSMNWGIIDYYRVAKPGYFALKDAFAPILPVVKQTPNNQLELYVINDTLTPITNATLTITLNEREKRLYPVSSSKDSVIHIATLPMREETKAVLELKDANGKPIGNNTYHFKPIHSTHE